MTTASDSSLIEALRAGEAPRERVLDLLMPDRERRARVVWLLAGTLRPSDAPIARMLLAQEIAEAQATGGATEALCTLVAIVARFASPDDALLLWRAHEANEETRQSVEVEQMARLGVQAVKATLTQLAVGHDPAATEARAALTWLVAGEASGAFVDLPAYFAWSDERFGLVITAPT